MSRRNTRFSRDILYEEDSFGYFGDTLEYLEAKNPKRKNQKEKFRLQGAKKKPGLRDEYDDTGFPNPRIKNKTKGRQTGFDRDLFW